MPGRGGECLCEEGIRRMLQGCRDRGIGGRGGG